MRIAVGLEGKRFITLRASPRRTCREERSFENHLARLAAKYPRIQNVCDSITWKLSSNPKAGTQFECDPDYWILQTLAHGAIPSFTIRYSFDDDMVYLWSIEPTGEGNDET